MAADADAAPTLRCAACAAAVVPARLCRACGLEAFCAACTAADHPRLREHEQRICFTITEPTGLVERAVCATVGGLGMVHQYVTRAAFTPELRAALGDAGTRLLVAGVVWNDFPVAESVTGAAYLKAVLCEAAHAPYLGDDAAFRLQPRRDVRWALGAVYKMPKLLGLPTAPLLLAAAGVARADVELAQRMLEQRDDPARSHLHFMRRAADEPDAAVLAAAVETGAGWFADAVARADPFVLGHLVHMVEDAYSAAHTRRGPDGALAEVYYYGAQSERGHSKCEDWAAVSEPGGEPGRRVGLAAAAVRRVLQLYVAQRASGYDKAEARRVLREVFAGGDAAQTRQ